MRRNRSSLPASVGTLNSDNNTSEMKFDNFGPITLQIMKRVALEIVGFRVNLSLSPTGS